MTLTMRSLPTAHDPATGAVTVATPSCCCCCCCCLATIGAVSGFAASAVHGTAKRNRRPGGLATTVAALAPLLAIVVAGPVAVRLGRAVLGKPDPLVTFVVACGAYIALTAAALHRVGASRTRVLVVPLAVLPLVALGVVIEAVLSFATGLLIELLSPLAVYLGVLLGRRMFAPVEQPPSWPGAPAGWAPPTPPPLPPPPPPPPYGGAGGPKLAAGPDVPWEKPVEG